MAGMAPRDTGNRLSLVGARPTRGSLVGIWPTVRFGSGTLEVENMHCELCELIKYQDSRIAFCQIFTREEFDNPYRDHKLKMKINSERFGVFVCTCSIREDELENNLHDLAKYLAYRAIGVFEEAERKRAELSHGGQLV